MRRAEKESFVPVLLRPVRAAELLSVSRSKLYSLINAGKIRAIRVGCSLRIDSREIERIASDGTEPNDGVGAR